MTESTDPKPAPQNDLRIHPPNVEIIQTVRYLPPGVTEIIARGGGHFLGLTESGKALKYPFFRHDFGSFRIEARLFDALGRHPRVIACEGLTEQGLVLQYASNGILDDYLESKLGIPITQKIQWCKQAAEAVAYIHQKKVIHCDINLQNFLLDGNYDLLLSDFQGMLKSETGETILDGLSRECTKSFAPRSHGDYADRRTDVFALGFAIYCIMMGHELFPDLSSFEDEDEIAARFEKGAFPTDDYVCSAITGEILETAVWICW